MLSSGCTVVVMKALFSELNWSATEDGSWKTKEVKQPHRERQTEEVKDTSTEDEEEKNRRW